MQETETQGTIVVGTDGSENARQALTWAVDEAGRRHLRCVVVHVVNYGMAMAGMYAGSALEELREAGQMILDDDVAFVRARGIAAEGRLELGPPAPALLQASKDAAMLVVGSHGHGGFVGMLLGSVSTACVHHAPCPVVVVPTAHRAPMTEDQAPLATAAP